MLHYTCEGLSDLGNGPNKPPATIIGEYSASYHHGTLISTWFRRRIHRRRDPAKFDREKKNFAVGLAEKVLVLHRESSARNVRNNENTYKDMGFFP